MANSAVNIDLDQDILVKDTSGHFKIFDHGRLKDVDLTQSELAAAPSGGFPNYQQPALPPADVHFSQALTAGSDKKPSFTFHPDDQSDLELELKKINSLFSDLGETRKYSVEKIARKLVEKNQLRLSDQQFNRLVKLLLSFFRQTRNLFQTKAFLTESATANGLGLTAEQADKIMTVVRQLKDKIESVDGTVVEAAQELVAEPPTPAAKPQAEPVAIRPEPIRIKPQPDKPASVTVKPFVSQPQVVSQLVSRSGSEFDLPKVNRPTSVSAPQPAALKGRFGKGASRLLGQVEELGQMTLEEWRLVDPDPLMRAAKILQRIESLAKDSITRKAQGIEAWRSNQVYRKYLMIGQKSLDESLEIPAVIKELAAQGQSTLTLEEFEAVINLNKKLRF